MPKTTFDSGTTKLIDKKSYVKQATSPLKKTKKRYAALLDVANTKVEKLNQLIRLGRTFNSALANLSMPIGGPFDSKAPSIATTDTGEGASYFDVKVDSNVAKNRVSEIEVVSTVVQPKVLISKSDNSALTLLDANLDGSIQLKFNDANVGAAINVAVGDSVATIVERINAELATNNKEYEAFIIEDSSVKDGNGKNTTGFIEIRAKSGAKEKIEIDFNDNGGGDAIKNFNTVQFKEAEIKLDGVTLKSDTNSFDGVIPGIDITVKKKNHGGEKQTLSLVPDAVVFTAAMEELLKAANDLSIFVESQNGNIQDAEGNRPPLAGSAELNAARQALDNMFGAYGEEKLNMLGLGVRAHSSDNPEDPAGARIIKIVDHPKLKEALQDIEPLKKIFINTADVVADIGTTSKMHYTTSTAKQSLEVISHPFELKVKINGAGDGVESVKATLHSGTEVTGKFENGYISFDLGEKLHGMRFYFDINGAAAGSEQKFTVDFNSGMFSNTYIDAQRVIDDEGKSGLAKASLEKVTKVQASHKEKISELDEKITKTKEDYDRKFSLIESRQQFSNMLIQAIIDLNDNN